MNQQRLCRYKSVLDKKQIKEIKEELNIDCEENDWDTNAISPGTQFMDQLIHELNLFFKELKASNKFMNIIFSSSYVYGEGEHKIMDYIRNNKLKGNIVIYGLDADLIMLGMGLNKSNVYLLREAIEFGEKVDNVLLYLDIDLFKIKLISTLKQKLNTLDNSFYLTVENCIRMIDDYIFICFILGNDFLPHNIGIDLRYGGHDILLENYLQCYLTFKDFLVNTAKMKINNRFLYSLFHMLSSKEHEMAIKIQQKRNKFKFYNKANDEFERRMELIKNDPIINNEEEKKVDFNDKCWKSQYYREVMNIEDEDDIESICLNYCEGLLWTFYYYFQRCISYEWKFNYLHSLKYLRFNQFFA